MPTLKFHWQNRGLQQTNYLKCLLSKLIRYGWPRIVLPNKLWVAVGGKSPLYSGLLQADDSDTFHGLDQPVQTRVCQYSQYSHYRPEAASIASTDQSLPV